MQATDRSEKLHGKEALVGIWDIVSLETHYPDGRVVYPFGQNVLGRLVYDADGYMSGQIMGSDRPNFASADPLRGTPEEIRTAFEGCISYYGTYDVREEDRRVTHHVECSVFPNWNGGQQVRFFEFLADGRLKLTTAPLRFGGDETITKVIWKRVK